MEAKDFSALRVSLASPDTILDWSHGEVLKPETINYRRLRPEKDGLFCEAIFGPTRDWQCYCGKYKNIRYKGIICDKCGVEVTRSSVRRERMGHIGLAAPVAHVWYTRRVPSYLGMLLDISRRNLDRVLYFAQYVVTGVDEEARNRALGRIEKELETKRRVLLGDIDANAAVADDQRAEMLRELEQRAVEINAHYESELARYTDDVVREGQSVEARLTAMLGEATPIDIDFPSANTVIAAKGETIDNDHIARTRTIVHNRIASLQEQVEGMRKQDLAALNTEAEETNATAILPMTDQERDIRERIAHIETNAEKARQELNDLKLIQFLNETRYRELKMRYNNVFTANMGAEAFHDILKVMNLDKLSVELWHEVRTTKSKQKKKKATKRLRVVESLRSSSNQPEWMILTVLPVIPPDLRPMVQLDGGRFATSDLNDLYRRVINRNNRLKHLLELGAPDVIVRNEKRMLQEAVDSLIDNSQRTKAMSRRGRRELKSLSDMLKGKKGRFRRNLLGKRVDYSGRSVIVIGPRLKLHQCGLPKTMALELYRPFVISRLCSQGYATNVKGAKRIIEREKPEVWEALEEVIKDRPVLLNRAPTLHRLGIQAFEPQLVEGKAIQIHPLVCSAFNADFDGDQMAVHVPLSDRAVKEARDLMLSTKNLLKPSDGQAIVAPAKDMVLGIYYLTMDPTVEIITRPDRADDFRSISRVSDPTAKIGIAYRSNGYYWAEKHDVPGAVVFRAEPETDAKKLNDRAVELTIQAVINGEVDCMLANGYEMLRELKKRKLSDQLMLSNLHERPRVVDMDEVEYLYNLGMVELHTSIILGNVYDNRDPQEEPELTTIGRAIFNRILPDEMRYKQDTYGKKQLQDLVQEAFLTLGMDRTPDVVDRIKDLGFHFATISGTTIAVSDLTIPPEREEMLREADAIIDDADRAYGRGTLTSDERYQQAIDLWNKTKDDLQERVRESLNPFGPVAVMAISGSTKGGFGPITQLAGMRGLMADPSGRIIDLPIRSHFREGLTPLEYFISTHGARKGLADTALRTANAGYLTRRLVDVAQDMIINRTDCGTEAGIPIRRADDIAGQNVFERIVGRCTSKNVYDPETGELIVGRNQLVDEATAERIQANLDIAEVHVRSPLTCSLMHGICALCYGRDLGRGEMVEIGTAVGIIAAQSIGEPGTQLTLRTFHSGGTAATGGDITTGLPRVEELFEARKMPKGEAVIAEIGGTLRLTKRDGVRIATIRKSEVVSAKHEIPQQEDSRWEILVADDQKVKVGTKIARDATSGAEMVATMEGLVFIDTDAIYIRAERVEEVEAEIPSSARLLPEAVDGEEVYPGQQLTEGAKSPHKILRLQGEEAAQLYLLSEVQKVYRSQGVNISDKHFEIVIRKMLAKVQVTKSGDSELLPGELAERLQLINMNEYLIIDNKEPAQAVPVLLGVTKAALTTDSFLSAASFQHTIRVLAGAAIEGKSDKLYGLKENVIIGKLIPAGTGFHTYQDRELIAPQKSLADQGALDTTADFDEIDRDDDERTRDTDED